MNTNDYFKRSVLESFSAGNGVTADFILKALIAMAVALVCGFLIYFIYRKFYSGVVYSSSFAATLVGMTVLTCALTLAISSNIVISLGMVGALSIVRYRTAIKDPMDLLYLFWAISTGIIVAAAIYPLAVLTMVVMILLVYIFDKRRKISAVYMMVVHFHGDDTEAQILRSLGNRKYEIRQKTVRKGLVEMTMQLALRQDNTTFIDRIDELEGVTDVSLIQYNGEYNG
ncbi:MAG: DUF4956 domain-containing protein [Lachnospiraceae bacterium]|nr:DUF4956 domain-containing protein [Lachnospiraceae bacterium]